MKLLVKKPNNVEEGQGYSLLQSPPPEVERHGVVRKYGLLCIQVKNDRLRWWQLWRVRSKTGKMCTFANNAGGRGAKKRVVKQVTVECIPCLARF